MMISSSKQQAILSLLERCRGMRQLKQLHAQMIATALVRDGVVPLSRLVDFCTDSQKGDLDYARSVFLRIDRPSVFIWNSMIRGLSNSGGGNPAEALVLYRDMQSSGRAPDSFTFPFVLKACALVPDGGEGFGRCVHGRVSRTGYESDLYVSSSLIHMYASCGDVESAELLFEKAPNRNVVGWTTMIAGYLNNGRAGEAVRLFGEMDLAGVEANEVTMVNVLVACAHTRDLETGRRVHRRLQRIGPGSIQSNVVLSTTILDMYARCGSLKIARDLFDKMPQRNEVSWNTMIGAYNQYGRPNEVLGLFADMRSSGVRPDKVTLLSLLGACAQRGDRGFGRGIHAYAEKITGARDFAVGTSLVDMYAKTGDTQSALQLFSGLQRRDVVTWTSMITGFAMHGHGAEAVNLFEEMQEEGVFPDYITFIGVMSACSHAGLVDEGRRYFNSMCSVHGITPTLEHYGCMVDLLSRAGNLVEAVRFIDSMPIRPSIAVWGALLSGCVIHGNVELAEQVGNRITDFNPAKSGVYVLLSNIYAGAGRWEGAERTREWMRQKGIEKTHGYSSIEVI